MVLPITDVTNHIATLHKGELEQYARLPIPDFKAFEFVTDKANLLKRAQEIGIPIPKTFLVEERECLPRILGLLEYPVVVKATHSRIRIRQQWFPTSVHYAGSEQELLQVYQSNDYLQYPSLVQERIIGPGVGFFALFDRGELVAMFSHKRLREKPPSGGVSVLRESIAVDPNLREYAIRLLKPLGWHGVAMMEYKVDQRTDQPVLMEVNGRLWGSLQLAIDAGVDFPHLVYQMAMADWPAPPGNGYSIGVKSRWLLGDVDHLLLRLLKPDSALHLPENSPSKLQTVLSFCRFFQRGMRYEDLRLDDPGPFFYDVYQYLALLRR